MSHSRRSSPHTSNRMNYDFLSTNAPLLQEEKVYRTICKGRSADGGRGAKALVLCSLRLSFHIRQICWSNLLTVFHNHSTEIPVGYYRFISRLRSCHGNTSNVHRRHPRTVHRSSHRMLQFSGRRFGNTLRYRFPSFRSLYFSF